MSFEIRTRTAIAGSTTEAVYELVETNGQAFAEVWPSFGFNCLKWRVPKSDGALGDLLFCDPKWHDNPVATRSGHPILFPFPNRLKQGKFKFEGREFQLPMNETSGQHAIHGFTPKMPWRVVDQAADSDGARLVGEFRLSIDWPDQLPHWPGDCTIRIEYLLKIDELVVNATVLNPGATAYPFGLGFHPYFCCPNAPNAVADDMILQTRATERWDTVGPFPTGTRSPVPTEFDFRIPKPVGALELDTLYAVLSRGDESFARLSHATAPGRLIVETGDAFRELLLFTPPHRIAIAIEPYTCITDAAHFPSDLGGWRELKPKAVFHTHVRYRWDRFAEPLKR